MKIITIDITQRSIRGQTYTRKYRGSLCSLPRKLTNVTPSGVKVNLAEKTRALHRLESTMNLLKGGEGRVGERGWGGDGGRVGREGGEGTWGRERGGGERGRVGERRRVGAE